MCVGGKGAKGLCSRSLDCTIGRAIIDCEIRILGLIQGTGARGVKQCTQNHTAGCGQGRIKSQVLLIPSPMCFPLHGEAEDT